MQTWFGRILPERERRFVAPRALAIQFGLGSVLLEHLAQALHEQDKVFFYRGFVVEEVIQP